MYYNGQIVHDVANNRPVKVGDDSGTQWAWTVNANTTHYIKSVEKKEAFGGTVYKLALPKSVEDAELYLRQGRIYPAPCPPTHCHVCHNWWTNHVGRDNKCKETFVELNC